MKTSNDGLRFIKSFEGYSSAPYRDIVGVWTIGYGHTAGVTKDTPYTTESMATQMLINELERFEASVKRLVKAELNQNQFDALVSFTYNLGGGALQRSTLRSKLNRGEYEAASVEFLKWCNAGGKKVLGLLRRRQAEMELFCS